jgi:hypothetical protein
MTKHIIGILLATVIMFVFGAGYWLSPIGAGALKGSTDDAAAQAALAEYFPEPGSYFVPSPGSDPETFSTLHDKGPVATVHVSAGTPPMQTGVFVKGFVHELITVILIAALLQMAAPALGSYVSRVGFVLLAGVAASLWVNGNNVIWWSVPMGFPIAVFTYDVLAWTLVGLVLAKTVRAS